MRKLIPPTVLLSIIAVLSNTTAWANTCPVSHPYFSENCSQCFADEAQAESAGCAADIDEPDFTGPTPPTNDNGSNNSGCSETTPPPSSGGQGSASVVTVLDPVAYNCAAQVGNGNDGCLNIDGLFVSRCGVVSNPANTKEAILDIEFNLGINIDDNFIANSGYQGLPPAINPGMSLADAKTYFIALIGSEKGNQLANDLNTNGDNWLDRNEATAAKGADPRQVLNTGFGDGLATDDVLAYVGLYFGDGAVDKYAGDLDITVKENLLQFTRTWQPGTDAITGRYTGPGTGTVIDSGDTSTSNSDPTPDPISDPTPPSSNASMGLAYIDNDTAVLYHVDAGHTGSWQYLCINGECMSGTKVDGRYQREVIAYPNNNYHLEFKVQDNNSGQCVTGEIEVAYTEAGNEIADTSCQ